VRSGKGYRISGEGEPIEYCVQMLELPQDRIMSALVQQGLVTPEIISELATVLRTFYVQADRSESIDRFGSAESVAFNVNENFEQTRPFIGESITQGQFDLIRNVSTHFLTNTNLFQDRIQKKMICDCHGDLHTGNIFITDKIHIFDCIEFNDRFRYGDILADIAYLIMDLEHLNRRDLADALTEQLSTPSDRSLLTFYKCYRAFVKQKVLSYRLKEPGLVHREAFLKNVRRYSFLAFRYAASLLRLKPCVIMMSGLSGTGKSRWAKTLAILYNLETLRTDLIRKELYSDWQPAEFGEGIYSDAAKTKVYEEMFRRANDKVASGSAVILDATFQKKEVRDRALSMFGEYVIVETTCSDENVVRHRLTKRETRGFVRSHAGWDVYMQQKDSFDPIDEHHVVIDTAHDDDATLFSLVEQLQKLGFLSDD
jgi:uncharacterized protein